MTTRKQIARTAGVLYLVMGVTGAFSVMFFSKLFVVPGDAAATAARIVSSPLLYRFGIVDDLACQAAFILLAGTFYQLFRDVDKRQAVLLVAFVAVYAAASFAIMLTQIAPLVLLSGAPYLAVFDRPQLEALALAFLRMRGQAIIALGAYMGLWLVPLGVLVYKSGFIPRAIGVLVLIAGVAYMITSTTYYLLPRYFGVVSVVMVLPYAAGELSIALWLLIKGARS